MAATLTSCSPLVSVATKPVITGKPFPHIFGPTVNTFGELSTDPRPESVGVTFTPAVTSWSAGPGARASLASLVARAARLRLAKLHRLGLGEDAPRARAVQHQQVRGGAGDHPAGRGSSTSR